MSKITDDALKAKEMGLSYGMYKALLYDPSKKTPERPAGSRRRRQEQKYCNRAAFALWQEGKNDMEIANALGVSRALIQRWRDTLELPSTTRHHVDTKKYRLLQSEDGTYYAIRVDDLTNSAKPIDKTDQK